MRNLVPDTWTADGEGALPKLGPCPHDNSCVGCRGTEMATSRFFCVEFDDIVETLIANISGADNRPTIDKLRTALTTAIRPPIDEKTC